MKILITVETPDDDEPHWPRQAAALREYAARVAANNTSDFAAAADAIGMTGGPNSMVATNGVRITERRIDARFFIQKAWDRLPAWLKRPLWWVW